MRRLNLFISLGAALMVGVSGVSCVTTAQKNSKPQAKEESTPQKEPTGSKWVHTEKEGAQLWSENCAQCHTMRSPSAYSDKQWETIMLHMRVRANLTEEESRKILEFLKTGN